MGYIFTPIIIFCAVIYQRHSLKTLLLKSIFRSTYLSKLMTRSKVEPPTNAIYLKTVILQCPVKNISFEIPMNIHLEFSSYLPN